LTTAQRITETKSLRMRTKRRKEINKERRFGEIK
jgi:hypothetical protein